MQSSTRSILTLIKILVSTGLIYLMVSKADLGAVFISIREGNFALLIVAFSLFFIGYIITSLRWKVLLSSHHINVSLLRLVQSFTVAIFFNNFLPSTIGGDMMRMYDSWRFGGSKSTAVSVIILDRFFGIFALLCYALVAALVAPNTIREIPSLPVWIGCGIAGAALFAYSIFINPIVLQKMNVILGNKIIPLKKLLLNLLTAIATFRGRRDILLKVLGLSFLLQLNVILHYIIITNALDIDISATAMFIIIPIAIVVMMLPISINAIGVRETVFVYLFGLYLVPREQAIAFAWVVFGFVLLQGIVGGIVFALRKNPVESKDG